MAESLVDAIWSGWRHPRRAMAAQVAAGLTERRALFHLTLACALFFLASVPAALRRAGTLDIPDPVAGVVSAHVFGYLALGPLLAYGLAALIHLGARGFGARAGFLGARSALFWAMLLVAPLSLGLALLGMVLERTAPGLLPVAGWLSTCVAVFGTWLLAACLAEVAGFASTRKVLLVIAAALGLVVLIVGLLARGGA